MDSFEAKFLQGENELKKRRSEEKLNVPFSIMLQANVAERLQQFLSEKKQDSKDGIINEVLNEALHDFLYHEGY